MNAAPLNAAPLRNGFVSHLEATSWEHGLVAGNGATGVVLYGPPGAEKLVVSHERLFRPLHPPRPAPLTAPLLDDLRAALSAGRPQAAADAVVARAAAEGYDDDLHWTDPLVPACVLSWTGAPDGPLTGYRRTVRFDTGLAEVRWSDKHGTVRYRTVVSRPDDVVLAELSTDRPGGLTGRLSLAPAPGAPPGVVHTTSTTPTSLCFRLGFTADWPGAVAGCVAAARLVVDGPTPDSDGDGVRIHGATRVLVLLRVAVHHRSPAAGPTGDPAGGWAGDPAAGLARELAAGLAGLPGDLEPTLARHAAAHGELFGRCRLDLGGGADHDTPAEELLADPGTTVRPALVEKAFDAGRHIIVSSTGALPPTLQGVWAGTWSPAWSSDYTLNGNVQNGAVAAMLSTATPELLPPLFDLVEGMLDDLRDNARRLYGAHGILLPARCSTHGRANHFNQEYCHTFWTAGAGWLGRLYVDYWLHTRDRKFLRERALPFLREAAAFHADALVPDTADTRAPGAGRLVFSPSYSPENASPTTGSQACRNATMDLAVLRDLLHNLIRAERAVGTPATGLRRWRDLLDALPDYRVTEDGALAEWLDPGTADNDGHRHASHLYPLFYEDDPAFTPDGPLRAAAAETIARRMRWRAAPGNDEMAFGLVQLGVAAAHLGDAETAYRCVAWLVGGYWRPNMVSTHNLGSIFNVDACGGLPALVTEMLVQSRAESLALLPALPAAWPRGAIDGVDTRAGVLVRTLRWEPGRVDVTLAPRVDTTIDVRLPWPAAEVWADDAVVSSGAAPAGGDFRQVTLTLHAGILTRLTVINSTGPTGVPSDTSTPANGETVMADNEDLEALARSAAAGDAAALDTLLRVVRPDVLRLCARFLPNREDAEDACQDTLLALARGISRFEGRSSFRTWLYRLSANRARSTYQALRGRFAAEAGGTPLPDQPDPRTTSVVAGTRLDLLDALESLRPDLAEAVTLRDILDLSYREIAVLLGLPEGTVKSRIHQARANLRYRLTGGPEPSCAVA